ncbi:hypothetical protein [Chamaesiphon sp. VAR_48_metabat_135_sub]|uniref:hypothetical protein n=1 Tax=Chamaesiphon sp. VAR_48_metabat_135_sub TaxID=2964699 RepID=UPI00286A59AE|nr:hypothetical protein [Chamaesiphon sp. VAR_48_metabat_135_sub]
MTTNKKKTSASDVLRQEMQQPLVIPTRATTTPSSSPTPITTTNMTPPTNDDAQAKAAQEKEAKLQQQKFDDLTKQLNDAKAMIVKLSEQPAAAPAKAKATTAIVKKDTSHASLTARPTQSREETLRRRNNTDIGWLD